MLRPRSIGGRPWRGSCVLLSHEKFEVSNLWAPVQCTLFGQTILNSAEGKILCCCLLINENVLQNEAMTGTHTQNPVYSRMTLALMEDTGWYLPNYELAQPLSWGRKLGCDFAMRSCKEWMDIQKRRWDQCMEYDGFVFATREVGEFPYDVVLLIEKGYWRFWSCKQKGSQETKKSLIFLFGSSHIDADQPKGARFVIAGQFNSERQDHHCAISNWSV